MGVTEGDRAWAYRSRGRRVVRANPGTTRLGPAARQDRSDGNIEQARIVGQVVVRVMVLGFELLRRFAAAM